MSKHRMEKENSAKRSGLISLPGCVTTLLVFMVIASLSMSAVVLWQLDALKREVRDQEVTIRKLQASKNNGDSQRRALESLYKTVQTLTSKVRKLEIKNRVTRSSSRRCPCKQGPKGDRGQRGARGPRGRRRKKRRRGKRGPQGYAGETGQPGPPGVPGPPGRCRGRKAGCKKMRDSARMVMFSESAHIEGYGGEINPKTGIAKFHRITNWKPSHVQGKMRFVNQGILVVGVSGYYYLYSQMFYYSSKALYMAHYLYVNERPLLRSLTSPAGERRKYNTNYHGGVFHLNSGDKISIRVPFNETLFMNSETSYFGAFLLYPSPTEVAPLPTPPS